MGALILIAILATVCMVYVALQIVVLSLVSIGLVRVFTGQNVTKRQRVSILKAYIAYFGFFLAVVVLLTLLGFGETKTPAWAVVFHYLGAVVVGTLAGYLTASKKSKK